MWIVGLGLIILVIHPSEASEDCDYMNSVKCGDICAGFKSQCHCGNQSITIWFEKKFCCVPQSNLSQCYVNHVGDVNCPTGKIYPMSKPCYGKVKGF